MITMDIGSAGLGQAIHRREREHQPRDPEPQDSWAEHGWALTGWQTAGILAIIGLVSALLAVTGP